MLRCLSALERLRQSEVENLDHGVGPNLDVGGLQIAVDNSAVVSGFDRIGDLAGDG